MLLVGAEVDGRSPVTVAIEGGRVSWVRAGRPDRGTSRGHAVLDVGGGAVLPGLHDHHVHLRALAAATASLDVSPRAAPDRAGLGERLRRAAAELGPGEWLRARGYHESTAGMLGAAELDEFVSDRPVRVQHRSGALWILNSRALHLTGVADAPERGVERDATGQPVGRLWRMDAWLGERVPQVPAPLQLAGSLAVAQGVTAVTDADPHRAAPELAELRRAMDVGALPLHVHVMGPLGLRVPEPASPQPLEGHRRLTLGPVKVLLDDHALPSIDHLVELARGALDEGRPVAVHCVTRVQATLVLAAFRVAREHGFLPSGSRLEHASVLPSELVAEVVDLGLTVVTQPGFVADRGDDYLRDVEADDVTSLYRARSIVDAGGVLAAGTDAPFGRFDVWAAVKAAVDRSTARGVVVGGAERLGPGTALALFLGSATTPGVARSVRPGEPADLCVLTVPWREATTVPSSELVAATVVAGEVVWRR